MTSIKIKNAALTVSWIVLIGWLLLVWAPMIRKDHEGLNKTQTEELIRNSRSAVEKAEGSLRKIQQETPPQIPQVPSDHGMVL
jgi:hypothetical protein